MPDHTVGTTATSVHVSESNTVVIDVTVLSHIAERIGVEWRLRDDVIKP